VWERITICSPQLWSTLNFSAPLQALLFVLGFPSIVLSISDGLSAFCSSFNYGIWMRCWKSLVSNKCLWGNLAISCMQQVLIGATGCSALWGIFQLAQQQILSWVSWYLYLWILTVIKVMVEVLLESHLLTSVSNQIQMPLLLLLLFMQDVSVILHHTAQMWPEVCKMTSNNMIAGVVPCFQSWWIWSIKYAVVKQWCLVRAEVPFDFWTWMLPTTIWLLWEWVKVMLCNCFSFFF
jgi:hypothetical protein